MLEANLILQFEQTGVHQAYNHNWLTTCNWGGDGPRSEASEYYICIELTPLRPPIGRFPAAASADYGELYRDVSSDEQDFPPEYLAGYMAGLTQNSDDTLPLDMLF